MRAAPSAISHFVEAGWLQSPGWLKRSSAARAAIVGLALLVVACGPGRGKPGARTAGPDDVAKAAPGLIILRDDCLGCHTEDLVRQQRLSHEQWAKVIDKMHRWGAPTEPDKIQVLAAWLTATYPRDAGAYAPETLSQEQAAAAFERLPDGPLASGKREHGHELYVDQCEPCHAERGEGGPQGMTLAGRHLLDRGADFAAITRAGRGRMPAFVDLTDAEIGDLLAYLRTPSN